VKQRYNSASYLEKVTLNVYDIGGYYDMYLLSSFM